MSEHYDFHYQPTGSGAISGQQVLQQTEDAINELGDYVNDNVGGAMDVAQEALETAQNAEQDAQTALDTANSFSSAIQSAQQDASTALSTAQTAQTTATNANNTAIQASQDANTAVTTANNASGQVSTLSGTVTALGQRVTTAEGNIGQNTSDITALTTRVGTAEGNITTLQNDVTIAQGNASSAMATAGQVKQQAFVFRYSSTALTPSSTNANSLLDNTDNLKVGDKVIDSSGVLFSITAIDTQNSTFTIGTALIDLAQDSDVMHLSGTVTNIGNRVTTAEGNIGNLQGRMTTAEGNITNLQGRMTTAEGNITNLQGRMTTAEGNIGNLQTAVSTAQATANSAQQTATTARQQSYVFRYSSTALTASSTNSNTLLDNTDNLKVGDKVIDSNGVLFSITAIDTANSTFTIGTALIDLAQDSDVVHKSGNETISGEKTFTNDVTVNNSNATVQADVPNLMFKNPLVERASTTLEGEQTILFTDKNTNNIASIQAKTYASGISDIILTSYSEYNGVRTTGIIIRRTPTTSKLQGYSDNITDLGDTNRRWHRVYAMNYYYGSNNVEFSTKFVTTDTAQTISGNKTFSSINGVEPSSLSLPSGNASDVIDISSYITALDGTDNTYIAPANGWISIAITGTAIAIVSSSWSDSRLRESSGNVRMLYPVLKNETLDISVIGTTLAYARFIPCQGNV